MSFAVSEPVVHSDHESSIERKGSFNEDEFAMPQLPRTKSDLFIDDAVTKTSQIESQVLADDYPDGGLRAWLVVFGVCF